MFDFRQKLGEVSDRINGNSFIRLYRGENRKNNLRKSRRRCMIAFACIAVFMCFLYISISSNASTLMNNSQRNIDKAQVTAKLAELKDEITNLEETDVTEYGAADLNDYNNLLENYHRSVSVLTELEKGDYDGKQYAVAYVDVGGELNFFGTRSWGYDTLYRSYVLDFLTMLIAIFVSITVANVFGAEYSEKTVKLMFTKPSTRLKLYLCKMTVVFKEAVLYSVIGFFILLIVNWASNGTDFIKMLCYVGNGVRVVGTFEQIFLVFLDIVTAAIFYSTLAAMFSVAAKSRVLPILCTILFSRLPELEAIKDLMREVAVSSTGLYNVIFSNHINLCQYLGYTQLVVKGTSFTISYIVLLAYIAVMFAATAYAFKKQRAMK